MSREERREITPELIWRGRLHIGDEPGVYGNASYVGLCAEWPLTLRKFDPESEDAGNVMIRLRAEDAGVRPPFKGHRVSLWRYRPAPTLGNPQAWARTRLASGAAHRLSGLELGIATQLPGDAPTLHVSLRIETDVSPLPGLYDDLVLVELSMLSLTHYASLGFQFESLDRT